MADSSGVSDPVDAAEKAVLLRYLDRVRDAMVWKVDGLSEYDARRPMTPTGTNLLGLVKHLACVEFGYFGDTFGRPHGESLSWDDADAAENADMFATVDESRADVLDLYARARAHADATIAQLPLDTVGRVAWWPAERADASLRRIVVHVLDETSRHAGHADICRELLDRQAGLTSANANLPDRIDWPGYVDVVERTARAAAELHRPR